MKNSKKKNLLKLSSLLTASTVATCIAMPLKAQTISPFFGINVGAVNGKAKGSVDTDSGEISLKTGKKTASTIGVTLGVEGGDELKYAVEVFANQALAFQTKDKTVVSEVRYKDPLYYGLQGRLIFNIGDNQTGVAPYLLAGVGAEHGKLENTNNKNYDNFLWIAGLGVQGKVKNFSVFGEVKYLNSFKSNNNIKTETILAVAGVKFYFE